MTVGCRIVRRSVLYSYVCLGSVMARNLKVISASEARPSFRVGVEWPGLHVALRGIAHTTDAWEVPVDAGSRDTDSDEADGGHDRK